MGSAGSRGGDGELLGANSGVDGLSLAPALSTSAISPELSSTGGLSSELDLSPEMTCTSLSLLGDEQATD